MKDRAEEKEAVSRGPSAATPLCLKSIQHASEIDYTGWFVMVNL